MKNLNKYISILLLVFSITEICFSQEWVEQSISSAGTIDFINPNIGWSVVSGSQGYNILRTMNKGVSWDSIYGFTSGSTSENIAIDLVNINLGFIYFGGKIIKTSNGGQNWITVYNFNPDNEPNLNSIRPLIKFVNSDTGYISYTRVDLMDAVKIFRTTNSGTTWDEKMHYPPSPYRYYYFYDLTFENNNPSIVTFCGYAGFTTNSDLRYFGARSTNGGETFDAFSGLITEGKYQSRYISNLPGQTQNCRMIMVEYRSNSDKGTYCYDFINGNLVSNYKINDNSEINKVGGFKFIDQNLGYVYIGNELYKTTNSGVNWNVEYTTPPFTGTNRNSHFIDAFGDQIFLGTYSGSIYTKKLTTNFQTYFDNQSTPSSIIFDGTQYASPSTQYLRGGVSTVSSNLPLIINPNQSNEKLFYKWSDGDMNLDNQNFYFDKSGTEIANYYKTKQLASSPVVINNMSQTNSLKDTLNAVNQIYESMGGIFFTKSYNNGDSFKREEISNNNIIDKSGNGNKNPSIYEARDNTEYGKPVTILDRNKNIVACWERFNPVSGKTEIKASGRTYYSTQGDTSFTWNSRNLAGDDIFTSFNSSSGFNSYPKIFAIAMDPFSNLGDMNTYFLIIPHLRPSSNGVKVQISARGTLNKYSEFSIDSGDVSDLSVIGSRSQYGYIELHLVYRKNSQIIYRKVSLFDNQTYMAINLLTIEGPTDISANDGYTARYRPDISIMDGLPVVSYAANYNSNAWVSYESGETDIINLHRYPIIKVHKSVSGDWGNYVIYNSTSLQDNPDIEGSSTTQSYLINYKLGNGQFKKVVKVEGQQGYFCEPNTFTGTDSKLIKNSYTGSFGNNLSLLTLSPEASLYRLSKQNFAITNIQTVDQYDNFGGVVNLDTVRYSQIFI